MTEERVGCRIEEALEFAGRIGPVVGCIIVLLKIAVKALIFFFKQKTAYEVLRSLVGSEMCIRDILGAPQADGVIEATRRDRAVARGDGDRDHDIGVALSLIHI